LLIMSCASFVETLSLMPILRPNGPLGLTVMPVSAKGGKITLVMRQASLKLLSSFLPELERRKMFGSERFVTRTLYLAAPPEYLYQTECTRLTSMWGRISVSCVSRTDLRHGC